MVSLQVRVRVRVRGLLFGLGESSVSLSLTDAGRFRLAGCSGVFFLQEFFLWLSRVLLVIFFSCVGYTNPSYIVWEMFYMEVHKIFPTCTLA